MTTEPYDRNKEIERVVIGIRTYQNEWDILIQTHGEKQIKLEFQKLVHEARMLSLEVTKTFPDGTPVFKTMILQIPEELIGADNYGAVQRAINSLCKGIQIGWVSTLSRRFDGNQDYQIEYRELNLEEKKQLSIRRIYKKHNK